MTERKARYTMIRDGQRLVWDTERLWKLSENLPVGPHLSVRSLSLIKIAGFNRDLPQSEQSPYTSSVFMRQTCPTQ